MVVTRKTNNGFAFLIVFASLLLVLSWNTVKSARTKTKIYIDLKAQAACFRRLNATNELGCSSSEKGNVGVVYYIQDDSDLDWVLSGGPNSPYVVVLNTEDFVRTKVLRLRDSGRVNGILVIDHEHQRPAAGFSSAEACPNDRSGMYRDNKQYGGCKKTVWNTAGSGLNNEDIGFPVFTITDKDDIDSVLHKCFNKFNKRSNSSEARDSPLCAAEVKAFMHAAVDGKTCMRRTSMTKFQISGDRQFCEPLGDYNIHTPLFDRNETEPRTNNSVIIIGARLDTTSLFQNSYWSADTSVTGTVALLATMEAVWGIRDEILATPDANDILFAIFNGETYDYIGSSSMVHSMKLEEFPQGKVGSGSHTHLRSINLKHINQFIELNQVGLRTDGNALWLHTDPDNRRAVQAQIKDMMTKLTASTQDLLDVQFEDAGADQPLPPASAQHFLMGRSNIPTIVITDHEKEFTNKYYNSRFDRADTINASDYLSTSEKEDRYDSVTMQASLLTNFSMAMARYLYQASTGKPLTDEVKAKIQANEENVHHMLYCFMVDPNCELFRQIVRPQDASVLEKAKQPYPFYVGPKSVTNVVSDLVLNLIAWFTGEKLDLNADNCDAPSNDVRYTYKYMQGNLTEYEKTHKGVCVKSLADMTKAQSPAFLIDGYDMSSGLYSTWTESYWGADPFSIRLFLIPSQQSKLLLLCTGLAIFLLSMVIAYLIGSSADVIFPNNMLQLQNSPAPTAL